MQFKKKIGTIAAGLLAASTLVACGADDKDGEPVAVSHQAATASIQANTSSIAGSLSASIQMLETSDIFMQGMGQFGSQSDGDVLCVDFGDPDDCAPSEPVEEEPLDLDGSIDEASDALGQVLSDYIFVDANIETEATTQITYLLRGSVVCEGLGGAVDDTPPVPKGSGSSADDSSDPIDDGGLDNSECIESVDQAEIRLQVTSPMEGDVDVAVLIGPQRHNPASFQFHQNLLSAEIDFAGAKASIEHIATAVGEEAPELPSVMAGRIRAELEANGAESVTGRFSVLTAIDIQHPRFTLQTAAANPAAELTLDGVARLVEFTGSMGALNISAISEDYSESIGESGEWVETVKEIAYDIYIPGLTGNATFNVDSENLNVTGAGLGNGTATVDIDGGQVLAIDLNANDGRTLDLGVSKAGTDDILVEVAPLLDLRVAFDFQNAPEAEGEAWMMNDVFSIRLDGDARPALMIKDDGTEVVRGNLSLALANDGSSVDVAAGQCLLNSTEEPVVGEDETVEPVGTNPVDGVVVGTCL